MIVTAKLVAICLGLAVTAFTVSTIVLAVQKSSLQNDLADAQEKMNALEQALENANNPRPTEGGAVSTTTVAPVTSKPEEKIDYRLPKFVIPKHYNLYLHPDLKTEEFSGTNIISVQVFEPTAVLKLHAHNLNIKSVYVLDKNSKNVDIARFYLDPVREFLVIELKQTLPVLSECKIGIDFSGGMKNKIVGLYSSSYLKADKTSKMIATSKFEPTYARQAFPCFDEPAMKAAFTITLARPKDGDYNALSNMNQVSETIKGDIVEVHFEESVLMSTYLACFIVSDFTHKQKTINTNGIGKPFEMRVFATPEQLGKVDFALEAGVGIVEYYIKYFQIEYPLPKLDMAAIPDFVSGAMEHWGLVTFRETSMLYEKEISSTSNRQRIAEVVAHELAHMWFGNLVTMMWWNDLWLNEGFASYIEIKGVDAVFPEWKMEDQFVIATLHGVLNLDATLGSHPIVQTVENPDQITEIFDSITYSKGSSIIRMLEDFVGPEKFQEAVTNYLTKYKYRNAVTDNFLSEIEALGFDFDVKLIMRTWTEQMGLPVVEVTKVSSTEYKLTQKRFFGNPEDENGVYTDSPFDYKWSIPITYFTDADSSVHRIWLNHNEGEITLKFNKAPKWIKINKNQVGYYRTNYPAAMWTSLTKELVDHPEKFAVADRAHLINDAFALADATQLPYDTALDITTYLQNEVEYVPWSVAASKLVTLKNTLMYTDSFQNYVKYARNLIEKAYREATWVVGDDHLKNKLRVTVLSAACSLGLPDCLQQASMRFDAWLKNPAELPNADIREVVYYYGMMDSGNEEIWEQMWTHFVQVQDASEKSKLMYGLSAVQVPWILSRYIDLAWDENNVRGQDYFTCLTYISQNRVGESLVWNYVRDNWQKLVDRFGLNERYLGRLIPSITARFDTVTQLEEMEHFFAKYPEAGAGTAARKQALEKVKGNIKWLAENKVKVANWLEKH